MLRTFGYNDKGTEIVEDEADVLREAADRILAAEGLKAVASDLRDRRVMTSAGKFMSPVTLRRLLLNPKTAAILGGEKHARLAELLTDPARRAGGTGARRRYLLSGGLAVCGLCGEPLQAAPSNYGKRAYACKPPKGCGRIRIAAEPLEADVAERVLARFASPAVRHRLRVAVSADSDGSLNQRIDQAKRRLAALAEEWADGQIDSTSYRAARTRLNEHVKDWEEEFERAIALEALPGSDDPRDLAEWWTSESTPVARRRDLVGVVLDHALIGTVTRPGFTGFDAARVTYVWR